MEKKTRATILRGILCERSLAPFSPSTASRLGVWFSEQEILKDVNLHMHCGSLNAIIGKNCVPDPVFCSILSIQERGRYMSETMIMCVSQFSADVSIPVGYTDLNNRSFLGLTLQPHSFFCIQNCGTSSRFSHISCNEHVRIFCLHFIREHSHLATHVNS